ncbi:MAG TPA: hypothetical protein VKB55_10345 [Nocardioidaceae bacterium]|jgi:hypothetical protein|nr:hypothetical protein [Nocardioidaceae bacterium]
MNDPTPSETVRTHYQARDSELREAALLAFAGAGYRVGKVPGTKPNLTVWHSLDDGETVAEMAERFDLQPSS